jgi:hypothetical protein
MSQDQLEEYRNKMRQNYRRGGSDDERLAKELQEEERNRIRIQAQRDEEIARKLNERNLNNGSSSLNNPQAYPPAHFQSPYYGNPSSYPPPSYPPPSYPNQPYNPSPYAVSASENQPLVNRQDDGFFPVVNDKCCYINTQVLVLVLAGAMLIGIIAAIVIVAVN